MDQAQVLGAYTDWKGQSKSDHTKSEGIIGSSKEGVDSRPRTQSATVNNVLKVCTYYSPFFILSLKLLLYTLNLFLYYIYYKTGKGIVENYHFVIERDNINTVLRTLFSLGIS